MICPNCKDSTAIFDFGTCIKCGFNHIKNEFVQIRVYVGEVSGIDRDYFIERHKKLTYRER